MGTIEEMYSNVLLKQVPISYKYMMYSYTYNILFIPGLVVLQIENRNTTNKDINLLMTF